tara:strand:- start:819 stop:1094 length:276 start_codon:yes stop_codon:yes gene_type:complete
MTLKWKTRSPTDWELSVHWADILFDIRKEKGLTRTQLADLSGISSNTIENYERKKIREPSIYKVEQILNAMGYDLDAIRIDNVTANASSWR